MNKNILLLVISMLVMMSISSCKTEFEKIRTSNDPERILESATQHFKDENFLKAQSLYDIIIPFYRGKKEADDIFFNYAYTYYNLSDYILASHYFESYAKTFGNSGRREEASFMSAYSNYLLSPTYRLDQTYTNKAIANMQLFVNNFPTSDKVKQCNDIMDELREKLEKKAFEQGKLYFKIRQYESAITSFKTMMVDYPDTKNAEEVNYFIIKSAFLLADNSIYEKRKERFEETIKFYNQFKKRYPRSKFIRELKNDIKSSNEQIKTLSV